MHLRLDSGNAVGQGGPQADLTARDLLAILRQALSPIPNNSSVLAIIADQTRDDNTPILFPFAAEILHEKRLRKFDALVAQGTHSPMTETDKRTKIGADLGPLPGFGRVFNHDWANPSKLIRLGQLEAYQVKQITSGLLDKSFDLRVNTLLAPGLYDTVLVFGTSMPHEVAGFSGGAKYFFPGVAGPELTHATHWLGALASIEKIIGRVETPTRHLFEAAADRIPAGVISLNSVVTRQNGRLRTHGFFCGDLRKTVRKAAEVSKLVHIQYTGRKYKRVLALLEPHLNDLWVGGKASYRLGPVIEEGGELIIYAPHLKTISDVHGDLIKRYGYAPLEVVREMVEGSEELQNNLCVAAHLAHVSFANRVSQEGKIVPRYSISLCSGIDEQTCSQVNLHYMDPSRLERDSYMADPDTLVVDQAGRDLYLVEPGNE
jgi:nickel-dependent lactate racemase